MPTRISLDFSSCTAWPGVILGVMRGAVEGWGGGGGEVCASEGVGGGGGGGGGFAWVWGKSCCRDADQDQSGLQQLQAWHG